MLIKKEKYVLCSCIHLRIKFILMLFLFSLVSNGMAYAEESSPLETIAIFEKGINAKDMSFIEQAVDVDAVLQSALDVFLAELKERRTKRTTAAKPTKAMEAIFSVADNPTSAKSMALKSYMLVEVKKFVKGVVEGGYLLGQQEPSFVNHLGVFSSLQSWFDDRTLKQVVAEKILSQQDNEALLAASYTEDGVPKFPLQLYVQKDKDTWRIKEICNLKELLSRAGNEQ